MQVDGPGMNVDEGTGAVHRSEQLAAVTDHDAERLPGPAAYVDGAMRGTVAAVVQAGLYQTTTTYTGMGMDINVHDQWAVESMGVIQDRTKEHLGYSDRVTHAG